MAQSWSGTWACLETMKGVNNRRVAVIVVFIRASHPPLSIAFPSPQSTTSPDSPVLVISLQRCCSCTCFFLQSCVDVNNDTSLFIGHRNGAILSWRRTLPRPWNLFYSVTCQNHEYMRKCHTASTSTSDTSRLCPDCSVNSWDLDFVSEELSHSLPTYQR